VFVEWITLLPASSLSNLSINLIQAVGFYFFLIAIMDFLLWKKQWALRLSIYSFLLLLFSFLFFEYQQSFRLEWRIYQLNGFSCSDLIVGSRYTKIAEDSAGMNPRDYLFQLKNARIGLNEENITGISSTQSGKGFVLNGLNVVLIEEPLLHPLPHSADILWVRKDALLKSSQLTLDGHEIRQIVL